MHTDGVPETGGWRHPWRWYLARGLGCFALGFGLDGVSGWLSAVWLAWVGVGVAIIGVWMLAIAAGEARRGRGTAWWRWYRAAYERNVRAAEHQATNEPSAPHRPNDR